MISGFSLPFLVSSNFLTDISILVKTISSWIFQTIIIRHLNANSLSEIMKENAFTKYDILDFLTHKGQCLDLLMYDELKC